MDGRGKRSKLMVLLALLLALAPLMGAAPPAQAAAEDVAMFYDALAAYGTWVDYADYGPVWYPTGVAQDWRPYVNGRWVPTPEGWVFETEEPWGWACYHYGNWFPTPEYGWVWVPGATWYPSTAAWRTSDEYVGWAPIPPPNYVPAAPFYPPEGYYAGTPLLDLLTAPFWIFAQAAGFLLGFGQPYYPTYSYDNCGCLAPFDYVPFLFPAAPFVTDCFYPFYAPGGFFFFGPPFPYVARVCRIDTGRLHDFVDRVNIGHIRNGVPSREILERHPFLRDAVPDAVREGKRFEVHWVDFRQAERNLNRPDAVSRPRDIPRLKAEIPKALVVPRRETGPEAWKGMKGMELPSGAQGKVTPQMEERMRRPEKGALLPGAPKAGAVAPEVIRGTKREVAPEKAPEVIKPKIPREVRPTTPSGEFLPRARAVQRPLWTPEESRQQQLQQERFRQRQLQIQQGEQRRMQQPGFREFQARQQEILRQRQIQPAPAREFRPVAPREFRGPSGGGGGGGGRPAAPRGKE
jgi:hypothetical protein